MSYGKFLRDHFSWLVIFVFIALTIEAFLLTLSKSGWLMIYVAIVMTAGFIIGTMAEYVKEKKYFDKCKKFLDELDKKYLMPELLEKGGSQEEKMIFDIISQMETGMTKEVSDYRRKSEEYKEYIETWVHEIKIPIATAKMIMENHKSDAPGMNEELEKIENYVEQALFYARSAEVEKDYFIKAIDIEQLVNDVIRQKKRVLIARHALIDIHDMKPEKEILSDGKWLTFIIGQIIDNAIKYSHEDKVALEIYLENDELVIKDSGIGIKQAELDRVFDKGFTGSNGRTGKASTGIGLYLCKKLCVRLEHDITIDSIEGCGTTVRILFRPN